MPKRPPSSIRPVRSNPSRRVPSSAVPQTLVIFDMDGVITSERGYWDAARLAVGEILFSRRFFGRESLALTARPLLQRWESCFTRDTVFVLAKHCINTNWDRAFMALGLQLLHRVETQADPTILEGKKRLTSFRATRWPAGFCQPSSVPAPVPTDQLLRRFLKSHPGVAGFELLQRLAESLSRATGAPVEQFSRTGPLWALCYRVFQEWFCGSRSPRKIGLLATEKPLIPQRQLQAVLKRLRTEGFRLGIATGRPESELIPLLRRWGVMACFETHRIVTHDTVARAQRQLQRAGKAIPLSKPHPYSFAKSLAPELTARDALGALPQFPLPSRPVLVSDTRGDILAARTLHCGSIGIITKLGRRSTRAVLLESGADAVVATVAKVTPALVRRIATQPVNP